jgi:5-methylcytosine-specific restriction endonuclease McrA
MKNERLKTRTTSLNSVVNRPVTSGMLNSNERYQKGLTLNDLYPTLSGICACGCGNQLKNRQKKWSSEKCRTQAYYDFAITKGDNKVIRQLIFERDHGYCQGCGVLDEDWQADHILPVHKGGGACNLENLQTLCLDCHKAKHHSLSHHMAISSQAASTRFIRTA